jgi:hypothetical protein
MGQQGNQQVQPAMGGGFGQIRPQPIIPMGQPSVGDPSFARPATPVAPTQPTNVFEGSAAAMRGAGETYGNLSNFQPNAQPYMNPYTQNVIDRTQQDIMRQQQMSSNQLGAQASRAGAFGGSRHGVAEGVMAGEYGRMAGDIAAQQRQRGYDQAMDAAFRTAGVQAGGASGLAGLGGQLYNMGQSTQDAIARQGAFQRQLEQQLADAARNQFYGAAGAPLQGLGAMTSVLGGIQVPTTSTSSTPFNPLGLLTAFI